MGGALLQCDDVHGLIGSLRHSGYKITQARRAVIETLANQARHITAPDLVEAVQERKPGVGRASVYRTLELLTRLGLVQSSTLGSTSAIYFLAPTRYHHHVICTECQKTVEFDECVLRELEQRLGETLGFQFYGHLVEIYGRCSDCLSH
jgi:Fe2+ or Zn2+ uptake regulation protein